MLTRSQRKRKAIPYGELAFSLKNVSNQKFWNEYLQHVRNLVVEEECMMKLQRTEKAFWNDVEVVARNKIEEHGMFCSGKCPLSRDAEAAEERIPKHALAWNDATEQCKREAARRIKEDPE